MAEIDWKKPLETEDGRPARVVCTDGKCMWQGCNFPYVVLVEDHSGIEVIYAAAESGEAVVVGTADRKTLIKNAPPPMVEREAFCAAQWKGGDVNMSLPYAGQEDAERQVDGFGAAWHLARITWSEPAPEPTPEPGRWVALSYSNERAEKGWPTSSRFDVIRVGSSRGDALNSSGARLITHIARLEPVTAGGEREAR